MNSIRLNNTAMKIAGGIIVDAAAMHVDYLSPSQFSREFKRMYVELPK
ncbi:hypothetical protein [Roseibium sp.]